MSATPESQGVQLYASEPGDEIIFSSLPQWIDEAFEAKKIVPIAGDSVDGTDWVYLMVTTANGKEVCRPDDWLYLLAGKHLSVKHNPELTERDKEQWQNFLNRRSS